MIIVVFIASLFLIFCYFSNDRRGGSVLTLTQIELDGALNDAALFELFICQDFRVHNLDDFDSLDFKNPLPWINANKEKYSHLELPILRISALIRSKEVSINIGKDGKIIKTGD